jgi:hypothetical protein
MTVERRQLLTGILVAACGGWSRVADASDASTPVAYVTEIHKRRGAIEVLRSGERAWEVPKPLAALRPGDQLRASAEARAVIFYHRGDSVAITSANSPYVVRPIAAAHTARQTRVVADAVTEYFLGQQTPPSLQRAATRGGIDLRRVVLLAPRHSRVFPENLEFEWQGPADGRYTIAVFGPQGVVWGPMEVSGFQARYPANAAPLHPGVRYEWRLTSNPGTAAQDTHFELLPAQDAARIRASVGDLSRAAHPPVTTAIARAAYLSSQGLHSEARLELRRAIASAPEEPTLYVMLARICDHIGLTTEATEADSRAQDLLTR